MTGCLQTSGVLTVHSPRARVCVIFSARRCVRAYSPCSAFIVFGDLCFCAFMCSCRLLFRCACFYFSVRFVSLGVHLHFPPLVCTSVSIDCAHNTKVHL